MGPVDPQYGAQGVANPRYAGAFCYGRPHTSKRLDGSLQVETVPQEEWPFLFQDGHVGYITWEAYEANRHQLQQNRQTFGGVAVMVPREEGPALLQGLVICGKCGNRMTIRYHQAEKGTRLIPEYVCQKRRGSMRLRGPANIFWAQGSIQPLPICCSRR